MEGKNLLKNSRTKVTKVSVVAHLGLLFSCSYWFEKYQYIMGRYTSFCYLNNFENAHNFPKTWFSLLAVPKRVLKKDWMCRIHRGFSCIVHQCIRCTIVFAMISLFSPCFAMLQILKRNLYQKVNDLCCSTVWLKDCGRLRGPLGNLLSMAKK